MNARILIVVFLLVLVVGAAVVASSDIAPERHVVEKVISNDQFVK